MSRFIATYLDPWTDTRHDVWRHVRTGTYLVRVMDGALAINTSIGDGVPAHWIREAR